MAEDFGRGQCFTRAQAGRVVTHRSFFTLRLYSFLAVSIACS